jgi:dTDP-4-amino-4,6-dideoxygalactose transaminase
MSVNFLPFSQPEIGHEEIQEVISCLESGWITTGPKTKQFEEDFANYIGSKVEAIAVNSATAGLHLALEALGVGIGDEVIVPTLTFTATAEVVRYMGADVVFVDVNSDNLNINIQALKRAITPRTKVIMPVHYAGLACEMDEILAIAKKFGLKVVEDAAHAFPASYKGRLVGSLSSDITVFSFYANKTMTTGEGGMVITSNKEIASRIKIMRIHGISKDSFNRFVSKTPAWFYEVVAPGFKYNMTDIASAIGIHQLKKIDQFLLKRQVIAKRYFEELADLPLILPANCDSTGTHAWHLYVIRIKEDCKLQRDDLIIKLSELGIGTSVHYIPLHRHPYWRDTYQLDPKQFPIADHAYQNMISLPLYTKMTYEDQTRVINALRGLLC